MSKRNFILFTLILIAIIIAFFGFLYLQSNRPGQKEGNDTGFISRFNPFGNNGKPNKNEPGGEVPTDVSGYEPGPIENKLSLVKVSSMPIAGYSLFMKERLKEVAVPPPAPEDPATSAPSPQKPLPPQTETVPAVRYLDRAEGNIYQTFADRLEERKFSATTIPKVYEAMFANSGEAALLRYLKADFRTIQTFWGILPKDVIGGDSAGEMSVRGTFLPDNITDLSISPDSKEAFYLFKVGDGVVGTTLDLATGKKIQVFDSPFAEWLSSWPNGKMITLTTKPAASVPGYVYKLDPVTKSFSRLLGGINGLTTLTSPDGKLVLYGDNNLSLFLYNIETKETRGLGVRTMPEKCAWTRDSLALYCSVPKSLTVSAYPDSWYQGETSFEDQIWKIDAAANTGSVIADISSLNGGEEIDGIKLSLDETGFYLFFVNKKDSFLWKLNLR